MRLLVSTAHELARAASSAAPETRPQRLIHGRDVLQPSASPGARERSLARIALEWAALAPLPATDRLLMLRPSAWIVVQAGGRDDFVTTLLEASSVPALVIDADPSEAEALDGAPTAPGPATAVCDDFEHEAQFAAAQVLRHVERRETPVALIAQDRLLVRRVRALLERHGVSMRDETGWKLSTTRAAAEIMTLLRAATHDATTDALVDWLKLAADTPGVDALEAACRRAQIGRVAELSSLTLDPLAARAHEAAVEVLSPLTRGSRRSLTRWLEALGDALTAAGAIDRLAEDAAGRQVLGALHLGSAAPAIGTAWSAAADAATMSASRFRAFVDRVLEDATFRPPATGESTPDVVVVPLAGAMLRPFAAAVLSGADDRHLGNAMPAATLLSEAEADALGVPTIAQRRRREALAFAHLLRLPRVTLTRRRVDGSEPLADSPLVERLDSLWAAQGRELAVAVDPRPERRIVATPIRCPAPAAAERLPESLSASACEALRACPYRFYALYLLGLREVDELDREPQKREYGNWLHAVLNRFHRERPQPAEPVTDLARLHEAARSTQREQHLAEVDFLPFVASFASFAPRYLDWLHRRDGEGAQWLHGEEKFVAHFEALGGTALHGVIDRIDGSRVDGEPALELIDYKTTSVDRLKERVREPFEDTQLAFYAALLRSRSDARVVAGYLPIDSKAAIVAVVHPQVEISAEAMVDGLGNDLRRVRGGAGLAALGSEETCEYCAARGVCRRDDWAEAPITGGAPR